jgi:putative oxygen-independent coproporphyrinogen III oxidase
VSTLLALPPLSLYVHIPWCIRKCPYCDFNSHQIGEDIPEAEYVAALRQDLQQDLPLVQGRKLRSIFFGGGTPSVFTAPAIHNILVAAEQLVGFEPDIEITLEANPGTFEQERFSDFRAAGVNRLSIGIQSFNDRQLQLLGRIHGREQALRAVKIARAAGFNNINLDIMHGLPQQSLADALADVQQALALEPDHLSWYQLTIEQNTVFYSAPPVLPDEEILVDIQDEGEALISAAGFRQYEVSAYAKPGQEARHNMNYWQFGDYLGIGAGAHGKITQPEQARVARLWKTRLPAHYLASANRIPAHINGHSNSYLGGGEVLSAAALPLEFLLNALRLREGVAPGIFTERTGLSLSALEPHWQQLVEEGLLEPKNHQLRTTALGHRFLNKVLEAYIDVD